MAAKKTDKSATKKSTKLTSKSSKLPSKLDPDVEAQKVISDIVATQDPSQLKDLTALFNICMTKKNVLRSTKLNELIDRSTDEMLARIKHHPGEFSHSDLISYIDVAQKSMDKIVAGAEAASNTPTIVNQSNTQINIQNGDMVNSEMRTNVVNAIGKLLNRLNKEQAEGDSVEVNLDNHEPSLNNPEPEESNK